MERLGRATSSSLHRLWREGGGLLVGRWRRGVEKRPGPRDVHGVVLMAVRCAREIAFRLERPSDLDEVRAAEEMEHRRLVPLGRRMGLASRAVKAVGLVRSARACGGERSKEEVLGGSCRREKGRSAVGVAIEQHEVCRLHDR